MPSGVVYSKDLNLGIRFGELFLVDLDHPLSDFLPGIFLRIGSGLLAQRLTQPWVEDDLFQPVSQQYRVAVGHHVAGDAILH